MFTLQEQLQQTSSLSGKMQISIANIIRGTLIGNTMSVLTRYISRVVNGGGIVEAPQCVETALNSQSLLQQASLLVVPSGYKSGVAYSEIPTNGNGDLTWSRASDATRVNSLGLVEKVRTNIITYSQAFDNAAWIKSGSNTVTANATTAPDGTTTADKIASSSTFNGYSLVQQLVTVSNSTVSIYAKANEITQMLIYSGAVSNGIYFNLSTGSFISYFSGSTNIVNYSITNVGNGWYRYSITYNGTINDVAILLAKSGNYIASYTSGEGFYVWGAQVEASDFGPTAYIPTTSSAVSVGPYSNIPRLNYQNGGGGCPSLLLEAQRTNVALYSEQFDNSYWAKTNATITTNQIASPDGYLNADKVTATTTSNNINTTIYGTNSVPYMVSIYAKAGTHDILEIEFSNSGTKAQFDLTNGTATNGTIEALVGGWYRCSRLQTGFTIGYFVPYFSLKNASADEYLYLWGAQVEEGSYPSSYIPTLGTSVTRVADECYKTGISSLIGQTSGTVFFDFTLDTISGQTNSPVLWYMKDGGTGERYVELFGNGNLLYIEFNGAVIANITKTGLSVGRHKYAIAYANNDMVFYVDGVQVGTSTSGTPSGFSTFAFQYYNTTFNGEQKVNQAVIFPTRLTNAQLAELTA